MRQKDPDLPSPGPEGEHFAVYEFTTEAPKGETVRGAFIVLKNENFLRYTRLEDVFSKLRRTISHYGVCRKNKLIDVCSFLNDLWLHYPGQKPEILLTLITVDDLQMHFDRYAARDGLSDQTILRHIRTVTDFAAGLAEKYPSVMQYCPEDLYQKELNENRKVKRWYQITARVPVFTVKTPGNDSDPFRDLPVKALGLLLQLSFIYAKDIAFALTVQAFSGLREGEVLSLRQANSCYGAGIRFIKNGEHTERIFLDMRKNYRLRGDNVFTGNIKRSREAEVFPAFIPALELAYDRHLHFLASRTFDEERAPMFINCWGQAMTYDTYLDRFHRLVTEHFEPALLKSDDPELRTFGLLLTNHKLTPHSLRHCYSVMLVLLDCPIEQLQYFRGDRSLYSCEDYLRRKSDLVNVYKTSQKKLIAFLLDAVKPV